MTIHITLSHTHSVDLDISPVHPLLHRRLKNDISAFLQMHMHLKLDRQLIRAMKDHLGNLIYHYKNMHLNIHDLKLETVHLLKKMEVL